MKGGVSQVYVSLQPCDVQLANVTHLMMDLKGVKAKEWASVQEAENGWAGTRT